MSPMFDSHTFASLPLGSFLQQAINNAPPRFWWAIGGIVALLVTASVLIVLSLAWQPYIEPWAMPRLAAMR